MLTCDQQGCCLSTSRSDDRSPYHSANTSSAIPPSDSRVPIAQESASNSPRNITQASASSLLDTNQNARTRTHLFSGAGKGNASAKIARSRPLKPAPGFSLVEAPMVYSPGGEPRPASSLTMLHKARAEFFETRVNGREEMWAVVQKVCELVETGSLEDARAILDAAGGTCPTGILWGRKGGCYDERGERYVVPAWCVGQPEGMQDDRSTDDASVKRVGKDVPTVETISEDVAGSYSREAKGKGKIVAEEGAIKGKEIRVKVRYSHTARDDVFTIGDQDQLELLAQRARQKAVVSILSISSICCMHS
jgi:hypothetical protein